MTLLVGLAGQAEAGKDTAMEHTVKVLGTKHYASISFGDEVKHRAAVAFGVPIKKFYEAKHEVDTFWGITYREMIQKFGTEFARSFDPDFWIKVILQDYYYYKGGRDFVFIPDVRFDNEAKWIRSEGGMVIEIQRARKSALTDDQRKHASERGISRDLIFGVAVNNRTPEDLGETVAGMIQVFMDK